MHTRTVIERLVPPAIRRNFALDFAAAVLYGVFAATITTYVPVVARRLGCDATQMAVVVAAPLAGSLFAPLAVYVPARRRMRSMVLVWIVSRSLFLLTLFTSSRAAFVIIVVLFWAL